MGIGSRLMHAWNFFKEPPEPVPAQSGWAYGGSIGEQGGSRRRLGITNERSIVSAIYLRLALDFASIAIRHVRLDDKGRYIENVKSGLNECLNLKANIDQSALAYRIDALLTLFDKGAIALCPIDTTLNPNVTGSYDIETMRVGEIVDWLPQHVRVSVYDDKTGRRREITVPKNVVAVIENPLYTVMNERNSTLQRLIRKLNILDAVDEQAGSGKLDLIIQLPYAIKSETKRQQAEARRKDIEFQLKGSKYGIAYTDGTEKITQLNRPAENNLWNQITDLTDMLYTQLGLTPEVMNGTANEQAMLNYMNRTIEPLLTAFTQPMKSTFLTKTARTQGQSIEYFRDPFKLVPIANIAEIADKFTRNEILSSNEIRSIIGFQPSVDPKADELRNSNMPAPSEPAQPEQPTKKEGELSQNGS